MNIFFLGFIGMWETVFLLVIVLVLFGARRLPELAKGLGQGIKEFKKATHGVEEELQKAFDVDDNPPRPPKQVPPQQQSKSHSENAASTASSKSDH